MATPSTVARPFTALSGQEVKKIILNEIERYLEADYRFKNHLTYPMVSWKWVFAAKVYPSDQPDIHVEIERTVKDPAIPAPFAGMVPIEVHIENERVIAAPSAGETADSARRDAGLPVPAPRTVTGPNNTKQIVDAPDLPLSAQNEPAKPAEVAPSSVTSKYLNRAKPAAPNSAVPARSVSIRTRANPGGVEVAPAAGSAPDADRAREIEELEAAKPDEVTEE